MEPIYTYNDKNRRWFLRQSIKGGGVCASIQFYKSKNCIDILGNMSEETNVKIIIYDIIEAILDYKNKHFKILEKEYEISFKDYRDEDVEEKNIYINEKFSKLAIHQLIKQIKLDELLSDFDLNYIQVLCGMKNLFIQGLRPVMLLRKI